jgi:hypothetical protein
LREEKIGYIGTGDEQYEEDDDHERGEEKKDGGSIARRERAGLFETESEIFVGIGMSLGEALGEELEFGGGFGLPYTGLQASGDGDPMIVAPVELRGVRKELVDVADGDPELRVENEVDAPKVRRGDTNNGIRMAGEGDGLAENAGVGIETCSPHPITEDDDRRILLIGTEPAAESESELRDIEKIGGGGLAPEALGIALA